MKKTPNLCPLTPLVMLLMCMGLGWSISAKADTIRVAVASNFSAPFEQIASNFEAKTGHVIQTSRASTGKHAAQILQGAPFDLFLAADSERPEALQEAGHGHDRKTYALGRLVLWSSDPTTVDSQGEVLKSDQFHRLAMANPRTAPYGHAALAYLTSSGLLSGLESRIVYGENVSQAYAMVATQNAEMGFIARSQLNPNAGSHWLVPVGGHPPITQQVLRLTDTTAAMALYDHFDSDATRMVLQSFGYDLPKR